MAYRIMVVDDEPLIRQLLTYQLSGAGYVVSTYAHGQAALEHLLLDQPDLVLLDVMMPDMSGWDVCRQIRHFSAVPIILLTAKSADMDVVTGLNSGADDYIAKPYSLEQLLARIEAVLRRSRATGSDPAPVLAHNTNGVLRPTLGALNGNTTATLNGVLYAPMPRYTTRSIAQPAAPPTPPTVAPETSRSDLTPEPVHPPLPNPLTYATLGRRLAEARRALGLSLYDAERESGIRWEFLQALERGHFSYIPHADLRSALARYSTYLGIDLRELIRAASTTSSDGGAATRTPPQPGISLSLVAVMILLLIVMLSWLLLNVVQ